MALVLVGEIFHEDKTSIHWKHEPKLSYATTTATTSVLLPLSRLTGLGNFCFSLLSPFLSIVRILSSQATSFQILLYALFPRFLWSTLLPFPSYFKLHNFTYLGVDVSMDDTTIPTKKAQPYHVFDLHKNIHPVILIIRRSTLATSPHRQQ